VIELASLPLTDPALSEMDRFEQQRDHLCGPYWAARVLRDAGVSTWDGQLVDQDLMATLAGARLPDARAEARPKGGHRAQPDALVPDTESEESRQGADVPRGARSDRAYRSQLPTTPAHRAGTSVAGLSKAIELVGAERIKCIPMHGKWSAQRISTLMQRCHGLEVEGAASPVRLIANLRTGLLWGTRPPAQLLLASLRGLDVDGPEPEWDVGHFCELAELLRGRRGELVVVADSYATLGWHGVHVQPIGVVAAALNRSDGRCGGVLAVAPAGLEASVTAVAHATGLEVGVWDNGSEEARKP